LHKTNRVSSAVNSLRWFWERRENSIFEAAINKSGGSVIKIRG
jgi:hypothetical protein